MVERNRQFSPKKEEKYKATERMANAKPNENKSWRNLAPQRNWRGDNFDQRKQLQCYECLSTTHLRPNCPQLKRNQPTEQINHVGSAHENELFAPYISEGSVNGSEIKILRDSGASVDIVTRNYVSNADLPVSPEFGEVVTKARIVDSSLDQGIYLLSNATAELLNKSISIATVNAGTTRSQKKGGNAKGDGKARRIESRTGGHQYKAPNNVMNNIVPDSASLRSATRSPTIDVSTNRNMFNVSTAVSTAINSTPKCSSSTKFQTVAAAAAASNLHYPPPIQRPGPATVTQAAPQPQQKIGIRPQASVLVPGGKLTPAQQAKLRAEAVQQTHMFFAQSKTGKHDESVSNMLSQDNKNNIQGGVIQKMPLIIQKNL
ncbi:hypothetical protein HNY73_021298 [Argiope bruennichi]|uniref:Uncharacterized protein n=1 Tax=Argiope bruennichi TaxID=94029 RepID=A0A8T0ECF4_ARGBR|nr:hypothetical protein HNY73_021298 [Argiope bruennichi]